MNKRYVVIISLLTLPILLMGALDRSSIATDSATTSKVITKPTTVPQRTSTQVSAPDIQAHNEKYDANGIAYPPCPGDPFNPSFPRIPICPNINGWPSNIGFDPNGKWGSSIYLNKDVYCPDTCTVTRFINPAATPPDPVVGLVLINSTDFQEANCPAGYIQVTDFNRQPAIAYIVMPDKVYGPFATSAELNKYKNNPKVYDCDVYVHPTDPAQPRFTPTSSNRTLASNYPKPNQPVQDRGCSNNIARAGVKGDDGQQTWDTQMTIKGYLGKWVSAWSWSTFDGNPSICHDLFTCGYNSYSIYDYNCTGAHFSSGEDHRDDWNHYYMWIHCRAKISEGYFFTESYQPASHLCTRVKPAWQH